MSGGPAALSSSSPFLAFGLVIVAAAWIPEQGRADAVILIVERAGIGEILDLAEHLDADAPMLGEVVFGAPAIFEAEAVLIAIVAHLGVEHGIERDQQLAACQFDDRTETKLIGITAARGESIFGLKSQADAVALALDQLVLQFKPDRAQIEVLIERLVGAERGGEQPAVGDSVLELEIVALAERPLFLVLLYGILLIPAAVGGVLFLLLGEAPMHGAAIFELLLALLDLGFLDFELGEGRLDRADGQTCRCQR